MFKPNLLMNETLMQDRKLLAGILKIYPKTYPDNPIFLEIVQDVGVISQDQKQGFIETYKELHKRLL